MQLPKPTIFFFTFLFFATVLQAQKETRETTQHATLGEVTLVKVYKHYTDVLNYEYFEKNSTIEDPVFGIMNVVGEYSKEGELNWESRFKKDYNDPTLGLVSIEQHYDEGELDTDYRIKENFNDPNLGTVNVVMSYYEGELEQTYKYKKQSKEDSTLGTVITTMVYDEKDTKDRETITYGTTTIEKNFYKSKLNSEVKTYVDEHNNYIRQEKEYYNGKILTKALRYQNGKKEGLQTYFYTDGVPNTEQNYKEGKELGLQKSYYSDGQLKEKETIDAQGHNDGEYVLYKRDGSITTKGTYTHGKKSGTWEEYGGHNSNLLKKCSYTENSVTCEERDYYDYGAYFSIKSITTLTKDKDGFYKNGPYTYYHNYEKNLIAEKGGYTNGKKSGAWSSWDDKGNSTCSITYLANGGVSDQKFASYSNEGTLVHKGSNVPYSSCGGEASFSGEGYFDHYDDGKIGSQKKYFDGTLIAEKIYKHGVLKFETQYKNEEKIGLIAFDDKKREKYTLKMQNDTTYVEQYQYNENEFKIKDKGFIVDKQKEPYTLERTVTYKSGELFAQGMVVVDTLQTSKRVAELSDLIFINTGVWRSYYKNGTLESLGEYKNNQPIGVWKSYYENGTLKEKGSFRLRDKPDYFGRYESEKIGVWTAYNKDSSIIEEKDFGNGL